MNLDEFLGHSKAPAISVNPVALSAQQQRSMKPKAPMHAGRLDPALQHAAHITKPQLSFRRAVDNNSILPWQPTLKHKYNAQVPLGYHFRDDDDARGHGDASSTYVSFICRELY
jgi:exosome complex exonuclease RRP6